MPTPDAASTPERREFPVRVASLERDLDTLLVGLSSGDEIHTTGAPIPGLDAFEHDADGWRYVAPVDDRRGATDERHRLVLLHPRYDGFISLHLTARCDLPEVHVHLDATLEPYVTAHHLTGALRRGQERPIDLELHPGTIPSPAATGTIRLVDAQGADVAPPVRLTLATDASLDCVLAGSVDGPWPAPAFEAIVAELLAGQGSSKRLAHRVDHVATGKEDPGWSRLPWRRS